MEERRTVDDSYFQLIYSITACAAATSCRISDLPFQWEGQNFDPRSSHIFHPIFLKLKTTKHIRDTNRHAKFGKDRFSGGVWATTQILAVHFGLPFLYFFLYSSLSVPIARRVVRRPLRAQAACFLPRKCLLRVLTVKSNI